MMWSGSPSAILCELRLQELATTSFLLKFILMGFKGFSQLGLGIGVFALKGYGTVLEELRLPLIEKHGLDLQLVEEIENADAVNQTTSENGTFSSAE